MKFYNEANTGSAVLSACIVDPEKYEQKQYPLMYKIYDPDTGRLYQYILTSDGCAYGNYEALKKFLEEDNTVTQYPHHIAWVICAVLRLQKLSANVTIETSSDSVEDIK